MPIRSKHQNAFFVCPVEEWYGTAPAVKLLRCRARWAKVSYKKTLITFEIVDQTLLKVSNEFS